MARYEAGGKQGFETTLGFFRLHSVTSPKPAKPLRCSLALAAYDSPNFPHLGELGVTMRYRRDVTLAPPRGPFRVHTRMDSRVVSRYSWLLLLLLLVAPVVEL